ncbi:hypothetical protein COTS27_00926 [Spirochaetota bacterium]|nr:hypothetical protein COTS27_00926 [Spirochaetota bacterium]
MKSSACIRYIGNRCFEATTTSAKQSLVIDASTEADLSLRKGTRPMENVLLALASCASVDIVIILEKAKQFYSTFHVDIVALRRDSIPNVFTQIDLAFHFTAQLETSSKNKSNPLDSAKITRAIELSLTKYCSVAAMLKAAGVIINYSLHIHPPQP